MVGSRKQLWRIKTGREVRVENPKMLRGTELEPLAIRDYLTAIDGEWARGEACAGDYGYEQPSFTFKQVGFMLHPDQDWLGGSPDGLLGTDVLCEFKCPAPKEDGTIPFYEEVPPYYMPQVQGLLEITDRYVCDFVCWTPGGIKVWQITKHPDYWNWMVPHLAEFQAFVISNEEPPRFGRGTKPVFPGVVEVGEPKVYPAF